MKLEGKVALVTGTSPNICGGVAEGLADEGGQDRLRGPEPLLRQWVRKFDR